LLYGLAGTASRFSITAHVIMGGSEVYIEYCILWIVRAQADC